MHNSDTKRFPLSCQTPVGWLRAISDGSHLIYLDWNQIGWTDPDRPDHVSRETITQLMAYFAGQRTNFTIPLRPANISPVRQNWLKIMTGIPYGTTISYAAFAGTVCATNPLFTLVTVSYPKVARRSIMEAAVNKRPAIEDNVARKEFLIAHEKSQLNGGHLILT